MINYLNVIKLYLYVFAKEVKSLGNIKCRLPVILACKRMSQKEIAEKSKLSAITIGRLYNEKWSQVSKLTIAKLCETLNVTVGELFVYEKQ